MAEEVPGFSLLSLLCSLQMELSPPPHLLIPRIRSPQHVVRLWNLNLTPSPRRWRRRWRRRWMEVPRASRALEQAGGKMVVELVGAFNELTDRMNVLSTSSSRILFKALKLSIPILQNLPLAPDGRSPLSKALSVALVLADLQVPLPPTSTSNVFRWYEVQ